MCIQQDNQTALHQASNNGHDEVVKVLLAAKATVNIQNKVSFVVQTLSSQHHCFALCTVGRDPSLVSPVL